MTTRDNILRWLQNQHALLFNPCESVEYYEGFYTYGREPRVKCPYIVRILARSAWLAGKVLAHERHLKREAKQRGRARVQRLDALLSAGEKPIAARDEPKVLWAASPEPRQPDDIIRHMDEEGDY